MVWKWLIYYVIILNFYSVSFTVPPVATDETENLLRNISVWAVFSNEVSRTETPFSNEVSGMTSPFSNEVSGTATPFSNEDSRTTIPSDEVDNKPCDVGWLHFRQKCFKLEGKTNEDRKTWQRASRTCTTHGGHLVSINSKAELDFLVKHIILPFKDEAWIGLNDIDSESFLSWQDGSIVNYTNFIIGEPNHRNDDEDCIRMIYKDQNSDSVIGLWKDTVCSQILPYICQKKIVYTEEDSWTTPSDEIDSMPCDEGWHHFRQKCYKLGGSIQPWHEAARICTTYGGHLVSINSRDEQHFLVNNIMIPLKDAVWIGLHDRDWESLYTWQDGSPLNYTNYLNNEPNHRFPDEDCIRMVANNPNNNQEVVGYWRDTGCTEIYPFLCQKKLMLPSVKNESEILSSNTSISNGISKTPTRSDEVDNTPCDVGWYHFREKCYRLEGFLRARSWHDAETICIIYGGHLVSINSTEELDFLVNNIMMPFKYRAWIGLHNRRSKFFWQDGSPVNFTNWMNGHPNNATFNENCVEMLYDLPKIENIIGQWKKNQCSSRQAYICQRKIVLPSVKNESEGLPCNTSMCISEVPKTERSDKAGNTTCNVGWHHFRQKCYKQGDTSHEGIKSWQEAENICTTYGGHLVSINSEAELDFLKDNILSISKYPVWIGLHDRDRESMYSWQDGSPVNYTNFMNGEPNQRHPDEDCIVMLYNNPNRDDVVGEWKDVKCSLYYSYICQKKIVSSSVLSSTDKTENLPSSTSGNLSLGVGLGVGIVLILVLALLGAGIYKYSFVQHFQRRFFSPVSDRPNLHIPPMSVVEEENIYEELDYESLPTDHPSANDIPDHNTEEDINYYEPVNYEQINHQRFEQMLQKVKSMHPNTVHPFASNIPMQNTKKKFNEQDDRKSFELRNFFRRWDNQRFKSSISKTELPSQIPTHSSTDNHHNTQEVISYYKPLENKAIDNQRFEQMNQNAKSLPQTTDHPSTNNIPKQTCKKEFFEQDETSYQQMDLFESGSDKANSLSQIPAHSSTSNLPMHSIKENEDSYVSMGRFESENKKCFENIPENAKSIPHIAFHPSTNDIPKQNSKKKVFEKEDNYYAQMA